MNLFIVKLTLVTSSLIALGVFENNQLEKTDFAKANQLAETVTGTQWLGILAPIAISPFFGITCLAGISLISEGTFLENNHFISDNPVLHNPVVFWVFLGLTLLTSIPRLTKVSKPFAQAIDQVETYAGIVTLLVIRIAAASPEAQSTDTVMLLQMGLFSMTAETLLCAAAVLNIIVINTIKVFFELLAWLTPIPSVDALLEATNKSICGCLVAIYAYSPLTATLINLLMFFACMLVFRWVHRRVVYARHIFADPFLAFLFPAYALPHDCHIQIFNQQNWGPFPAKSKLIFAATEDGWQITQRKFFGASKSVNLNRSTQIDLYDGWLTYRISIGGNEPGEFTFTRRYSQHLDKIRSQMHLTKPLAATKENQLGFDQL